MEEETDGRLFPALSSGVSGNLPGQHFGEYGFTSSVTNNNTYNPGTHNRPNYTPYYGYPNKYGGKPRKSKKKNRRNRKKTYKNRH